MPNEQKGTLDINQFIHDLLGLSEDAFYHASISFRNLIIKQKPYEKTVDTFASFGDEAAKRLFDKYNELVGNAQTEEYQEFAKFFKFMWPLFDMERYDKPLVSVILKKLDIFDKKSQYLILKHLMTIKSEYSVPVLSALASSEYATTQDKVDVAMKIGHKDIAIVRDAIEALKADLDKELDERFPDTDTIRRICDTQRALSSEIKRNQNNEIVQYLNKVYPRFEFSKIIEFGFDYIAKYERSAEERAIEAEKQLRDKIAESNSVSSKLENTLDQLNLSKQQNEELSKEIKQISDERDAMEQTRNQLDKKNQSLTNQLNDLQAQLKRTSESAKKMRDAAAQLKGGLGTKKDIEEFKKRFAERNYE